MSFFLICLLNLRLAIASKTLLLSFKFQDMYIVMVMHRTSAER